MRTMHVPAMATMALMALVATIGLGMFTPVRAQANDTGKILLGVAAGAILYGLLNRDSDRRCDDYAYRKTDPRCYESGGHWYWRAPVDRRPEQIYGLRATLPDRNRDDRYTRDWDRRRGTGYQSQGQSWGQSWGHDNRGQSGGYRNQSQGSGDRNRSQGSGGGDRNQGRGDRGRN